MREGWVFSTVGEIIAADGGEIKTGPFGTTLKASEYAGHGVPLISVGEVGNGKINVHPKTPRVSPITTARLPEYVLRAGDIVFGRKGAVERSALVSVEQDGWFLGSDGIRLRLPKAYDARFACLWMQSASHKEWIQRNATGSTMASLNQKIISRIPIPLPPLTEQRAIAATLGALDDKIELNRKMNETLEAMARALFRDWFVDFGPTRAKMAGTTPYLSPALWSLFPDRLDYAGKPEGWELFHLGQIAEHHTKTLTPERMAAVDVEHFSLPAFDKGQIPALDAGATIKSNKTLVPAEAVLLSKLNPEIPRIWMPETQSGLQQVSSTEFLAFTAKAGAGRCLLFCLFSDQGFRAMLHGMVTGTSKSHQRISPPSLLRRYVITGTLELFGAFEESAAPLLERVRANRAESRTLAQTRDLLLPCLMSGELRVASADKNIETAA